MATGGLSYPHTGSTGCLLYTSFGRYLGVSFSNDTVTPATVEVIAQSQGPIIES